MVMFNLTLLLRTIINAFLDRDTHTVEKVKNVIFSKNLDKKIKHNYL